MGLAAQEANGACLCGVHPTRDRGACFVHCGTSLEDACGVPVVGVEAEPLSPFDHLFKRVDETVRVLTPGKPFENGCAGLARKGGRCGAGAVAELWVLDPDPHSPGDHDQLVGICPGWKRQSCQGRSFPVSGVVLHPHMEPGDFVGTQV